MDNEPKVCCGCKVSTAAYTIAILGAIGSFASVIILALAYGAVEQQANQHVPDDADRKTVTTFAKAVLIIGCVVCAIQFLFSCLVIFGIATKRPKFLLPWIIWGAIGLVLYALNSVIAFISGAIDMDAHGGAGVVFGNLVGAILGCLISFGCIHIMRLEFNYLKTVTA